MMQNEPNNLKRSCLQQIALFKENISNLQVAWTNTATRVGGFIALIAGIKTEALKGDVVKRSEKSLPHSLMASTI